MQPLDQILLIGMVADLVAILTLLHHRERLFAFVNDPQRNQDHRYRKRNGSLTTNPPKFKRTGGERKRQHIPSTVVALDDIQQKMKGHSTQQIPKNDYATRPRKQHAE